MANYAHEYSRRAAMATLERLTISLPADMAAAVTGAAEGGDCISDSKVVRGALDAWKMKRALQLQEPAGLKAEFNRGPTDVAAGRVQELDAERAVERGRKPFASRSPSA
jgi:antitoxin ParD1/3/4